MTVDAQDPRYKFLTQQFPYLWVPQPGPQQEAYLSKADILLYGGAAGGGKSALLVGLASQEHYRTVIYRRSYADIASNDGIAGQLKSVVGSDGYNGSEHIWTCPEDPEKHISLGALEKPNAEQAYQGRAKDFIGFDEGAQLPEGKVRYVIGWLRTDKKGQRTRVVIASNPPTNKTEGQWLITWFGPWVDKNHPLYPQMPGKLLYAARAPDDSLVWLPDMTEPEAIVFLDETGRTWRKATADEVKSMEAGDPHSPARRPLSYTFIPAKVQDNKYLNQADYIRGLQSLPPALRDKLLYGDFTAGRDDAADQVIPTEWVEAAFDRWRALRGPDKPLYKAPSQLVLSADVAQGGADRAVVTALRVDLSLDPFSIRMGKEIPDGPAMVGFISTVAQNDCLIVVDNTGGWGGSTTDILKAQNKQVVRCVYTHKALGMTANGIYKFANLRAEMYWRLREMLDPRSERKIALCPDTDLQVELCQVKYEVRGDTIHIEPKDEIRSRIGRSPDKGDCCVMAYYYHKQGQRYLTERMERMNNSAGPEDRYDPLGGW